MGTLNTITAPTIEPITQDELKDALRIDGNDDDLRLKGLIVAARNWAENYLDLRLMNQVVELTLDRFPADKFSLDVWPIQSVDSVKYDNTASPSVETTLVENTDYRVDIVNIEGRMQSIGGWPSVYNKFNSVRIRMTVGYATQAAIPQGIKEGIKTYAMGQYLCNPGLLEMAENMLWNFKNL